MIRTSGRLSFVAILCGLVPFAAGLQNEFVDWDDQPLLVDNQFYQGFSPSHFHWMFTTTLGGHYQPLTWLSYSVDFAVWGLHPFGFHFTNLVLHLSCGIGFYFIARRILQILPGHTATVVAVELGALVATVFWLVHPLRVESVAWTTERRDVLSGFWIVAATLAYLKWVNRGDHPAKKKWYALALVCYVLSLLSKAVGMTWPILLLLLDFFPLRRIPTSDVTESFNGSLQDPRIATAGWRQCILEKIPMFLAAILSAVAAAYAQRSAGAMWDFAVHPLSLRIAQAFYGVWFYLGKTIWPNPLLPLYEQPVNASPLRFEYVGAMLIVVGITIYAYTRRRSHPGLFTAWFAYVVLLSPMLGIAQSGPQVVADRYSYLPSIPLALLIGGAVTTLLKTKRQYDRAVRPLLTACWILFVGMMALTHAQVGVWKNSRTLWEHVIFHAPQTGLAHAHLSAQDWRDGNFESAMNHGLMAIQILPGNRGARWTVARAAVEIGNLDVAEEHLLAVISLAPNDASAHALLGTVFARRGDSEKAEAAFRQAVRMEPEQSAWRFQLGGFLASFRRFDEAHLELREAARLQPSDVNAWFRIGVIARQRRQWSEAKSAWTQGLNIDPSHLETKRSLAWLLSTCVDQNILDGERALDLMRTVDEATLNADIHAKETLAAALARCGRYAAAVAILDPVLEDEKLQNGSVRARILQALECYRRDEAFTDPLSDP